GTEVIGIFEMIVISVVSGLVAGFMVTAVAVGISLLCYKRNKDLDMVGAPAVTTFGDIATLPCLVITALLVMQLPPIGIMILSIIVIALIVWAVISIIRGTVLMKDILKEGIVLLIPLSILGIVAGVLYTNRLESLIAAAAVLILISPFMNGCGSIGGILTSRIGTEMHMGLVDPKALPQKLVWNHFLENYIYALVLLPLMGMIAHFAALAIGISTPGILPMVLLALIAGILVVTVMNLLGYYTATIAYRLGFDPDNFGVPVVTSTIDLIGASSILVVMMFLL
ncbi:MAG TPA: magnesium transporter, partial [Methanocorpusculum sp.]|nr:magnesium transporter [Methanocorpusculum sp.]